MGGKNSLHSVLQVLRLLCDSVSFRQTLKRACGNNSLYNVLQVLRVLCAVWCGSLFPKYLQVCTVYLQGRVEIKVHSVFIKPVEIIMNN